MTSFPWPGWSKLFHISAINLVTEMQMSGWMFHSVVAHACASLLTALWYRQTLNYLCNQSMSAVQTQGGESTCTFPGLLSNILALVCEVPWPRMLMMLEGLLVQACWISKTLLLSQQGVTASGGVKRVKMHAGSEHECMYLYHWTNNEWQ